MLNLLFGNVVPVANNIEFHIRTLGEILEFGEERYFQYISVFLADPFDYMYPLFKAGIDYEDITEFELFLSLMGQLTPDVMQFLFGDTLSFENMVLAKDNKTEELVLVNPENPDSVFNASTLFVLADVIRQVHYIEHEVKRAGNKAAKDYFLQLAAKRAKRKAREEAKPVLKPLIISLVNAPEFPYNYNTVKDITIYQFFSSIRQIPKRLSWNYIMQGIYAGTIDQKSVNWREIDWLSQA